MDSPQLKSCMAILYKILCQLTEEYSDQSGKLALSKQRKKHLARARQSRFHTIVMHEGYPEITIGSKVALQNNETKCWDIYGTVTEIGPHRKYFVKTYSSRVLV